LALKAVKLLQSSNFTAFISWDLSAKNKLGVFSNFGAEYPKLILIIRIAVDL